MPAPSFVLESAAGGVVVGLDEAGRGPWAGPVVAACVRLDPSRIPDGIDDSKKLSSSRREALCEALTGSAQVATGLATVEEIDALNILQASLLAMRRAYEALGVQAGLALVDGNRAPMLSCPVKTVIGGDRKSLSIAAASIVAKVTRDTLMRELAETYPGYGFERHAGYGTQAHQEALRAFGVTPAHRKSFAPIRALVEAA